MRGFALSSLEVAALLTIKKQKARLWGDAGVGRRLKYVRQSICLVRWERSGATNDDGCWGQIIDAVSTFYLGSGFTKYSTNP